MFFKLHKITAVCDFRVYVPHSKPMELDHMKQ